MRRHLAPRRPIASSHIDFVHFYALQFILCDAPLRPLISTGTAVVRAGWVGHGAMQGHCRDARPARALLAALKREAARYDARDGAVIARLLSATGLDKLVTLTGADEAQ